MNLLLTCRIIITVYFSVNTMHSSQNRINSFLCFVTDLCIVHGHTALGVKSACFEVIVLKLPFRL